MRISYWSSDVCSSDLFGIHFSLRAQGSRIGGLAPPAALVEAAGITGGPLLLCAVTSALAFFSFFPTAYRGLSELGLIAGAGMVIALFLNLTLLPALLRSEEHTSELQSLMRISYAVFCLKKKTQYAF